MNERFDLAHWELAPDSPEKLEGVASGRIKAHWLGDEREFLLREVEIEPKESVVFARRRGAPNGDNWVLGYEEYVPQLLSQVPPFESAQVRAVRDSQALCLLRLVHFDAARFGLEGTVRVTWSGKRGRLWIFTATEKTRERVWGFDLELPDAFFDVGQTSRVLAEALNDRNSDAHFALHFAAKSDFERRECALTFKNGSLAELERMLSLVLQLATWGDEIAGMWALSGYVDEEVDAPWGDHLARELDAETVASGRMPPFHRAWRRALGDYFSPSPNEKLKQRHLCLEDYFYRLGCFAYGRAERPNSHQRLEAALELRDWARGKVPDELIATLLSLAPM